MRNVSYHVNINHNTYGQSGFRIASQTHQFTHEGNHSVTTRLSVVLEALVRASSLIGDESARLYESFSYPAGDLETLTTMEAVSKHAMEFIAGEEEDAEFLIGGEEHVHSDNLIDHTVNVTITVAE